MHAKERYVWERNGVLRSGIIVRVGWFNILHNILRCVTTPLWTFFNQTVAKVKWKVSVSPNF
jgi:hypothetical protein